MADAQVELAPMGASAGAGAGSGAGAAAAPPPPAPRDNEYGIDAQNKQIFLGFVVIQIPIARRGLVSDMVHKLRSADLRTQVFFSAKRSTGGEPESIFVKVYASAERLLIEADNVDQNLVLDRHKLREYDVAKNQELQRNGLRFNPIKNGPFLDDLAIPPLNLRFAPARDPYDNIYAPYDVPESAEEYHASKLFYVHKHTKCILSSTDALNMLLHVIENPDGGAGLNLDALKAKKKITNYFVLHDRRKEALGKSWLKWCAWPWDQPLNRIRGYFGEKVGMYFAFLGMYTQWLAFPAVLGLAMAIHQYSEGDIGVTWLPVFGILIALWITFFLEFWKRRQSMKAMEWGMSSFKEEENLRPEYKENKNVDMIRSMVNGKPIYWDSPLIHHTKVGASFSVIFTAAGIVITVVMSIFTLRVVLVELEDDGELDAGFGGLIASVINALQIQIMNLFYMSLAQWLNDWENHKTDTAYENSLITKVCLFQFINSYISLFYIAFLKGQVKVFGKTQECENDDCLAELRTQLGVIFITRLVVGNFTELALPRLKVMWGKTFYKLFRRNRHAELPDEKMSATEEQSFLAEYEPFEDYLELLIQFGYASLFVVAFPLTPALAMINNYVEIRVDSFKLLHNAARPIPAGAQDIGSWYAFLEILGYAAVFTNLGVVIFTDTSAVFGVSERYEKLSVFVILEHIVFFLKFVGDRFIPDAAYDVQVQLARQKYLVDKHIRFIPDEIPEVVKVSIEDEMQTTNPLHAGDGDAAVTAAARKEVFIAPTEEQAARKAAYNDLLALQRSGTIPPVVKTKKQRQAEQGVRVKNKAQRGQLRPAAPAPTGDEDEDEA